MLYMLLISELINLSVSPNVTGMVMLPLTFLSLCSSNVASLNSSRISHIWVFLLECLVCHYLTPFGPALSPLGVRPFSSIQSDPQPLDNHCDQVLSKSDQWFQGEVVWRFSTIWPHLAPLLSPLGVRTLLKYKFWSPPLGDHCKYVLSKSDQWFQRKSQIYKLFTHDLRRHAKVDCNSSPEGFRWPKNMLRLIVLDNLSLLNTMHVFSVLQTFNNYIWDDSFKFLKLWWFFAFSPFPLAASQI